MIIKESEINELKKANDIVKNIAQNCEKTKELSNDRDKLAIAKRKIEEVITKNSIIENSRFMMNNEIYCKYGNGEYYKTDNPISEIEYMKAKSMYLAVHKSSY